MFYNLFLKFPNDSGPIYQETIEGSFPVEPFNTTSNLIFIIILAYFIRNIGKKYKEYPFFLFAIPVIFISWVGGTVYHGTRSHEFWLVLDWFPIMVVCFGGIVYFINKIKNTWRQRFFLYAIFFLILMIPRILNLPKVYRISFGYVVTALSVITPFIWYAYLTKWKNFKDIVLSIFIFCIAICFRTLDNLVVLLPMGTHWLWHTFGGISVFFLLNYIYKDAKAALQ